MMMSSPPTDDDDYDPIKKAFDFIAAEHPWKRAATFGGGLPSLAWLDVWLGRAWFGATALVASGTLAGLVVGCLFFGYLATRAPDNSWEQGLYTEVAAGFGLFMFAPAVFAFVEWAHWTVVALMTAAFFAFGLWAATLQTGVWQSFWLEASVGVILLVALERAVHRWVVVIFQAVRDSRDRLAEAKRAAEEAAEAAEE